MTPNPSKSAVRRAGSIIRADTRGECTPEEGIEAIEVMLDYRATFVGPMQAAHERLVQVSKRLQDNAEISWRLKRESTIYEKLSREPGLDLSRMQDIGGCRAVVKTPEQLQSLHRAVLEEWGGEPCCRVTDYVQTPRSSGYRAIHIIVRQDGKVIEIQLRTTVMQGWAETVEAFSLRIESNLKQDGVHVIQRYMAALSAVVHASEYHLDPPSGSVATLRTLLPKVSEILAAAT